MARLRATILGCGSSFGVPRFGNDWGACDPNEPKNRRSRCALLIERFDKGAKPTTIIVDTGPDIRAQMLTADVKHIDAVIYTHSHADHIHGIDDLRAAWQDTKKLVNVYSDAPTIERLEHAFSYCFRSPQGSEYPPILKNNVVEPGSSIRIDGAGGPVDVSFFQQVHGNINTLGVRVGDLAYSCDVSALPDESLPSLRGLGTWIVDALRYRDHPNHFSVSQSLAWIERLTPQRAILTHMHTDLDYSKLKQELPEHVEPAYDGMQIEVND